jgi:hypothetical protein
MERETLTLREQYESPGIGVRVEPLMGSHFDRVSQNEHKNGISPEFLGLCYEGQTSEEGGGKGKSRDKASTEQVVVNHSRNNHTK